MRLSRTEMAGLILDIAESVRGVGATGQEGWKVCVLDERREPFAHFGLASYSQILELERRLAPHGYRMKVLDPEKNQCDFLFDTSGFPRSEDLL